MVVSTAAKTGPISPLYLPYISPVHTLYLPYISPNKVVSTAAKTAAAKNASVAAKKGLTLTRTRTLSLSEA